MMTRRGRGNRRMRTLAALLGAAAIAVACSCAYPVSCAPAYATYRDVADTYATVKPIETKGEPLAAADIPDGKYGNIEVRTSSKFCNIDNCTVVKKDGGLFATFTLSKSYNAIYLGTAEDAARETDENGTDETAYILGSEVEVGKGKLNQFTLGIPSMNTVLELATFNGGKGIEQGCWYDRTVVFDASPEINLAIQSGHASSGEDDDSPTGGEGASGGKGEDGPNAGDTSSGRPDGELALGGKEAAAGDPGGKAPAKSRDRKKNSRSKASDGSAAPAVSAGNEGGDTGSEPIGHDEDSAGRDEDSSSQSAANQSGGMRGTPLSFASLDLDIGQTPAAAHAAQQAQAESGVDVRPLVLTLAFALLMAAGFVLRLVVFRHEKSAAHA